MGFFFSKVALASPVGAEACYGIAEIHSWIFFGT
jgi:hypothetical protein